MCASQDLKTDGSSSTVWPTEFVRLYIIIIIGAKPLTSDSAGANAK